MELFSFDPNTFLSFYLTLFRVSILVFLLPFFGGNSVPSQVKAAMCIVLTLAIWPSLGFDASLYPAHPLGMALLILGELLLGLTLGLVVQFIFAAIQTGGQLVGFQMGFAMVNVVDPMTGTSEAVTAHFLYMVALLTFLALNGHLLLLQALTQSFHVIPPGGLLITSKLSGSVLDLSREMFILAVRIAGPVMAALFLVDLALALIGRAAPQMNVLLVGFPLKIAVGFFFLSILFALIAQYMRDFLVRMGPIFGDLLKAGAP